jgi:hypothetical protein
MDETTLRKFTKIGAFTTAWKKGAIAFFTAVTKDRNPFPANSMDREEWIDGYNFARAYQFCKSLDVGGDVPDQSIKNDIELHEG